MDTSPPSEATTVALPSESCCENQASSSAPISVDSFEPEGLKNPRCLEDQIRVRARSQAHESQMRVKERKVEYKTDEESTKIKPDIPFPLGRLGEPFGLDN